MSDQAKSSNGPSGLVSGSEALPDASVGKPREWKVDGWLLVLCVWLVMLGPIVALFDLSTSQQLFQVVFQQVAGEGFEWLPFAAALLVRTLGFWAGLSLWGIRKGAVPLAKTFLKVDLAASLARNIFIAMFFQGSTEGLRSFGIAEMLMLSLMIDIPFFFIWNSYLNKSRRVKRTFGL